MERSRALGAEWGCPHGHRFAVEDGASPKWCPGCGTSSVRRAGDAPSTDNQGAVADDAKLRAVYEAACAWAGSGYPVTDGSDGRLRAAIDRARGQ